MVLRSLKRALAVLLLSCPASGLMATDMYGTVACSTPVTSDSAAACADACDDGCDDGEGCCGRGYTCYAGVEATFLSARFDSGSNFITFVDNANGVGIDFVNDNGTLEDLAAAPRIWVGVQNECGTGLVFRYWEMNQCANVSDPFLPLINDFAGVTSAADLEVYALDLEITKSGYCGCWDVLGSFGVRHARLSNDDSIAAFAYVPGVDDILFASANAGGQFNGTGITGALQGYRPLREGCCGSFDLFASGRLSVLWGNSDNYAITTANINGPGINGAAVNAAFFDENEDMIIAEFQVGVQWSKYLQCCGSKAFARVAFEYQDWQTGQGDVIAGSLGSRPGIDAIGAFADTRDLDIKFYGIAIAAGLTW